MQLPNSGLSIPSTCINSENETQSDDTNSEFIVERSGDDISQLAQRITRESSRIQSELLAFSPEPGSYLDPHSTKFDAHEWVKAFVKLSEVDPNFGPSRSLGVAFRNLSAFGWNSGAEFQKTTGSIIISLWSQLANLFTGNKRKQRIEILRNFEGIVERGEMLLVLGPPGSGCSTLLKVISGEMAGIQVSKDSYMNFRGMDCPIIRHRIGESVANKTARRNRLGTYPILLPWRCPLQCRS
jgi:ATP-binding cassette, subfamily G (WHITE), member 2, PDR